jgi:hypothetical protein
VFLQFVQLQVSSRLLTSILALSSCDGPCSTSKMAIGVTKKLLPTTKTVTSSPTSDSIHYMLRRLSSNPQLSFEPLLSFTYCYNHACIARAICVSLTDPVFGPAMSMRRPRPPPGNLVVMLGHFRGRSSTAQGSIDNTHRSILFGQPNASHPTPILDVL